MLKMIIFSNSDFLSTKCNISTFSIMLKIIYKQFMRDHKPRVAIIIAKTYLKLKYL